ncbi:MAG: Tim44 domain-containing protein [Betaproteobacteria bacterium]|nr:Tim44 domain-containing protein [Betaproteobacteria bacterium]
MKRSVSLRVLSVLGFSAVLLASTLVAPMAEAKRLGGGSNAGRQAPIQRQAAPATPGNPATPAAPAKQAPAQGAQPAAPQQPAPAPARNSWLGPVAGLAAGLGLAALASHFGFGEELMSGLLVVAGVLAVLFLVRLLMSRSRGAALGPTPAAAAGPASTGLERSSVQDDPYTSRDVFGGTAAPAAATPAAGSAVEGPSDADIAQFLQVAREQFIALQKLWDSGDVTALRSFATPAMAKDLAEQIQARGAQSNVTSVVSLDSEWLGMDSATDDDGHEVDEAYVRFHGLIRESAAGAAEPFNEVWTLQKRKSGLSGWLLAGITQTN